MNRLVQVGTTVFRSIDRRKLDALIQAIRSQDVPVLEMHTRFGCVEATPTGDKTFSLTQWLDTGNARSTQRRDLDRPEVGGLLLDFWKDNDWNRTIKWRPVEWPGSGHTNRVLRTFVRPQLGKLEERGKELSWPQRRWILRNLARTATTSASDWASVGSFKLFDREMRHELELWVFRLFLNEAQKRLLPVGPDGHIDKR